MQRLEVSGAVRHTHTHTHIYIYIYMCVCVCVCVCVVPHRYPADVTFYIFIQQIYVLNILNMLHTLRIFLFKMPFIS
jgi:hypothetical protein